MGPLFRGRVGVPAIFTKWGEPSALPPLEADGGRTSIFLEGENFLPPLHKEESSRRLDTALGEMVATVAAARNKSAFKEAFNG